MLQEAGTIDEANLAGEFCDAQDMTLCGYDDYCPNGRGHDPYPGGPIDEQIKYWDNALEESQRAPFCHLMGSFFSRQRGGVAPVLLDVGEVGGGRGREKSMVMDVPLLRTVPSKLGEGGGGG